MKVTFEFVPCHHYRSSLSHFFANIIVFKYFLPNKKICSLRASILQQCEAYVYKDNGEESTQSHARH